VPAAVSAAAGSARPVPPGRPSPAGAADCFGAARRPRAAAPAVPRSWTLMIGRAGPASCRAGRRPGRAGEETWVIILPDHASPVVPVHRRSRLLEPDRAVNTADTGLLTHSPQMSTCARWLAALPGGPYRRCRSTSSRTLSPTQREYVCERSAPPAERARPRPPPAADEPVPPLAGNASVAVAGAGSRRAQCLGCLRD
jgi:hypothetical protein